MCYLALALLFMLLAPLIVTAAVSHLVSLPLGDIQGVPCPTNASVTQFLGVPYAQPMLGSLRFRPPQLFSLPYPTPALMATTIPPPCGSICRQRWDAADITMSSENCLFLNIWVPHEARQSALQGLVPVRVYIHGGVQNRCSASDPHQDGCSVTAATGTIQVNMQFRTGAFGLLAHPATWAESNTTGNWALMDQQLALRWVQENIAFFGGDPSRVLLFGNSAGGQAVNFHVVAPGSAGLFTAAIAESPPCTKFVTLQQAYHVGQKLMNATGCSAGDSEGQLACLRGLPWSVIVAATDIPGDEYRGITMCEGAAWQPPFHPCMDGTVIREPMLASIERGEFNAVPYLGGLNHDEGRGYVQAFFQPQNLTEGVVAAFLEEIYPGADPQPVLHVYQDGNYIGDPEMEFNSMADMWTDMFFACPARKVLTARQKQNAPTWNYMFQITPTCPHNEISLGASHTAELFFVFGLTKSLPPPSGDCDLTAAEVNVSAAMMSAWKSMATNGYPTLPNGTAWEQWTEQTQTGAVISTTGIQMQKVDHAARCDALDNARRSSAALFPNGYDVGMSLEEVVGRVGVRMARLREEKLVATV